MKSIVAIASGKGGVGKSTVAANLAVTLANYPVADNERPLNVALIDVDFYGPSIPTLMGGGEISPDAEGRIIPAKRHGVKFISIAFFLQKADEPIIWRGPMIGKGMQQLFSDVNWGDVDITIVDMPPGTGDAQISLSQMFQLDGAVMVTTPQEVALSDVRRAINMFRKVNVAVLGIVENMAGYVTPTGERVDIFGSGGGKALSEAYDIALLGSIPLDVAVREGGDVGKPIALSDENSVAVMYREIAGQLVGVLKEKGKSATAVNIVN